MAAISPNHLWALKMLSTAIELVEDSEYEQAILAVKSAHAALIQAVDE